MSNIEEFKKLYNFEFEEIKAKDYKEIEKKKVLLLYFQFLMMSCQKNLKNQQMACIKIYNGIFGGIKK